MSQLIRYRGLVMGIAIALNIAACAPKNSSAPAAPPPAKNPDAPASPLTGLTTEEALRAKYNRVELDCDVRLQYGRELNLNSRANEHLTWDLLSEFAPSRTLKVFGEIPSMHVSVTINVVDIQMVQPRIRVQDTYYEMQDSPELATEVYTGGKVDFANGPSTWSGKAEKATLNERIPSTVANHSVIDRKSGNKSSYILNVICMLNTEAKPEYANQFKVSRTENKK